MAKITEAVLRAVKLEKGKEEVNIAQAGQLIKKLDWALGGKLYKLIRATKKLR